jgi:hypothetical protein
MATGTGVELHPCTNERSNVNTYTFPRDRALLPGSMPRGAQQMKGKCQQYMYMTGAADKK